MSTFEVQFPNYCVSQDGKVFKNGKEITPFKSNKYLQVLLYDTEHKRHVFGVHTLVAMVYLPEFYPGCIVHHKDKNCHNNKVENLRVMSRKEHSRTHGKEHCSLGEYNKKCGSWNRGKHLSENHKKHLSTAAVNRGFNGNQYVDKYGNRKIGG